MKRPSFIPFTTNDVVDNHDRKLAAVADGDIKTAVQRAERSADFSLCIDLGLRRITRHEFNERRDDRLRLQAERLERNGHGSHTIVGLVARSSIFGLTKRHLRTILKKP